MMCLFMSVSMLCLDGIEIFEFLLNARLIKTIVHILAINCS
jgi:hypothetical protein